MTHSLGCRCASRRGSRRGHRTWYCRLEVLGTSAMCQLSSDSVEVAKPKDGVGAPGCPRVCAAQTGRVGHRENLRSENERTTYHVTVRATRCLLWARADGRDKALRVRSLEPQARRNVDCGWRLTLPVSVQILTAFGSVSRWATRRKCTSFSVLCLVGGGGAGWGGVGGGVGARTGAGGAGGCKRGRGLRRMRDLTVRRIGGRGASRFAASACLGRCACCVRMWSWPWVWIWMADASLSLELDGGEGGAVHSGCCCRGGGCCCPCCCCEAGAVATFGPPSAFAFVCLQSDSTSAN